jgi:hypothetical protein
MTIIHKSIFRPLIPRTLLVLAILFACIVSAASLMLLRPQAIHSYEDQVADALRRNQINYQHISLGERWPDHINFQYGKHVFPYSYRITVVLQNGTTSDGWLTCAKLEHECTLSMADLALNQVPLRDFTRIQPLPIPAWMASFLAAFLTMVLPQ